MTIRCVRDRGFVYNAGVKSLSARSSPEDLTPAVLLAENVLRLKDARGLSLSEIARRAEIHRTHVSLILRGKRMIQIDTVVKLAGALDAEPGELLTGIAWVYGEGGTGGHYAAK